MGFERAAIFGIIELELEATATGTLALSTDLPGNAMAVRETKAIPVTTTRRVVRFRLQGTTKGRLYSVKVSGSGIIRLYGGRIWARVLPGQAWAWYPIPIPETSEEWQPMKLPIPGIGEWEPRKLPIPEIGEWQPAKLPIPEVGEWQAAELPIPKVGEWQPAKLPIPEIGEWQAAKLPIPPTSEEWQAQKLPIKPTPDNPEWVSIEVDQ